ncbi:SHC2 protein, partial [Amia calva]|nr:SHC2 protein [Amia calva]
MPQWKFSNASSFLSRSPSSSSSSSGSSNKDSGGGKGSGGTVPIAVAGHPVSGPVASLAAVLNSCDPICVTPCSLQAVNRLRGVTTTAAATTTSTTNGGPTASPGSGATAGMSRRNRVEGMRLGGEDFTNKGSFIHKPSQGWLHTDKKITGPGASYIVRYMGCIEVLKSMRSLDFNTRTQVTREAINRLYEAVPGVKGAWKKKVIGPAVSLDPAAGNQDNNPTTANNRNHKCIHSFLFIAVNISIEGLNLVMPTTRQVIANHPMQSISFASGGDTDTPDYVAYVAKDPVNQRACHILECCDGLAQSVISTIGQAFELQFKQYLHSPPKAITTLERNIRTEESAWGEDEEASEHDYYNSIPGKEPPVGGVVDSRLRPAGALLGHIHAQTHSSTKTAQTGSPARTEGTPHPHGQQLCYEIHWDTESTGSCGLTSDGYLRADGHPRGGCDYEEHLYVNTQSLENWEGERGPGGPPDSPKKDLFDMRYHGRMSRRDAERLLVMDGDFLVRDSVTNPGQYVLTGMNCGLPKHLLLVDPEGVVRTKDMLFESISHLINYHLQNQLPIVAAESELHLKQVVRRKQ